MRFFEYESRKILEREKIPVAPGGYAQTAEDAKRIAEEVAGPVVIKSQVLTGGRMKAGGVKFADTPEEAEAHAQTILDLEINGHKARGLLVGAKAEIKQENYAGVVWDGIRKLPSFVFSPMGGTDIEEGAEPHPDKIGRGHISTLLPQSDFQAKKVIASTGVTGSQLNRLIPFLSGLARIFVKYDMTLAEINPLVELTDGRFVALDAHMEMENEARGRHKELLEGRGAGREKTRQARGPPPVGIGDERVGSVGEGGVAGNVTDFDGNLGLVIGA